MDEYRCVHKDQSVSVERHPGSGDEPEMKARLRRKLETIEETIWTHPSRSLSNAFLIDSG